MAELFTAHPSAEQLAAFGLGRLNPAEQAMIERHVATCAACCQALSAVPDDTLLGRLRSANTAHEGASNSAETPLPSGALDHQIPPELVNHVRYRIVRVLGSGGMGLVFEAEHRMMERRVALKVIGREFTRQTEAVERFRLEVKAAAQLDHPNIVRAYDAEQAGDLHFLVMEYVDGASLARVVEKRGPLPVIHACNYVRQAALGLQHASEHGMVHRDIKPHNLMLTRKGQVKVLDFGLARLAGPRITTIGTLLGTPDYIAPEQAVDARRADTRSDLYSLGCTLYFLLAGRPPFAEAGALDKLRAHADRTALPLDRVRGDVPRELAAVVERMMAKGPGQRFQTPSDVARALAPFARASQAPANAPTAALRDEPTVLLDPIDEPAPKVPFARRRRRRARSRTWPLLLGTLLALTIAGVGLTRVFQWLNSAKSPGNAPPVPENIASPSQNSPPRILLVVPYDGFWFPDYEPVRRVLDASRAKVQVASTRLGEAKAAKGGHQVKVDLRLQDARPDDYDAIIFLGGYPVPDFGAGDLTRTTRELLQAMDTKNRKVATLCTGCKVICDVDYFRDQKITGPEPLKWNRLTKDRYVDQPVVVSGNLITGRDSEAGEEFARTLLHELGWDK